MYLNAYTDVLLLLLARGCGPGGGPASTRDVLRDGVGCVPVELVARPVVGTGGLRSDEPVAAALGVVVLGEVVTADVAVDLAGYGHDVVGADQQFVCDRHGGLVRSPAAVRPPALDRSWAMPPTLERYWLP